MRGFLKCFPVDPKIPLLKFHFDKYFGSNNSAIR